MQPYRKEKIASVVRQIVSEAIAQRIRDPRVAPFTSVTRVEMSGDLQIAKVYLSLVGDPAVERRTLEAIRHARGFLQGLVAKGLSMRHCPDLHFDIDLAEKMGRRTLEILADNLRDDPSLAEPSDSGNDPSADPSADPPQGSACDPPEHGDTASSEIIGG